MSGVMRVCARCPQTFKYWYGVRAQTLCGDCRYVLGKEETRIWAA